MKKQIEELEEEIEIESEKRSIPSGMEGLKLRELKMRLSAIKECKEIEDKKIKKLKEVFQKSEDECNWCECDFGKGGHDWREMIDKIFGGKGK